MKLSVVSIAFNNLEGLKKTFESFRSIDFSGKLELIVVDGGSTDGTAEFLSTQNICNNWISEPDNGIYNAMNKGLGLAGGEYIWFLNSGDYVARPETILELLDALQGGADAYYGETVMVDQAGNRIGTRSSVTTRKLPEHLNWKSFRMGMNVSHQSFIVKTSKAVRYDESLRYVADIDWMIRTLKNCQKVVNLHKELACFTLDGYSSINRAKSNKERFKVLNKHYGTIPNLLAHLAIVLRKALSRKKL